MSSACQVYVKCFEKRSAKIIEHKLEDMQCYFCPRQNTAKQIFTWNFRNLGSMQKMATYDKVPQDRLHSECCRNMVLTVTCYWPYI